MKCSDNEQCLESKEIYKTGTEQIWTSTKIRVRIMCIFRQYVQKTKSKADLMTKGKLLSKKYLKAISSHLRLS